MFDSPVQGGQPATFSLGGVSPAGRGPALMVEGEKRRFWILCHEETGFVPVMQQRVARR